MPPEIISYIKRAYVLASTPRKPGPARGRAQLSRNLGIWFQHQRRLTMLSQLHDSREVKELARAQTAAWWCVSTKTVQRIIANPPARSPG